MEVEVERENINPLLNRKEIYLRVKYQNSPTPSRNEIREKVAGLFNTELEKIVVSYIKPQFGHGEAICYVKIYNSVEDLKKTEPKHIIARNFESESESEEGS
ncbi:SSU ribosomal protein S24E [Archaeoglobus sulfaticallidus PM70-1]|uniref:Small ribosomal subunit protein eS24 n=1 Tax=Archaeoglobus sulfaticallidus PM70-1 TaxID=387631 RepID=N0BIZ1_9EURY|nr:30S ribosomal protein S24e [Archaeoglobus sulfaticallidus]AGK60120.1 SSU ribosomal protein S24E [Archaeoglobus sulfaticallidus PM70-1]